MNEFVPNFRDRQVVSAVKKLVLFSLSIIGLPLTSMFFSKKYLFEGYFGYNSQESVTYAAIIAVILVHIVLAAFVYTAWNETDQPPASKEKKRDWSFRHFNFSPVSLNCVIKYVRRISIIIWVSFKNFSDTGQFFVQWVLRFWNFLPLMHWVVVYNRALDKFFVENAIVIRWP